MHLQLISKAGWIEAETESIYLCFRIICNITRYAERHMLGWTYYEFIRNKYTYITHTHTHTRSQTYIFFIKHPYRECILFWVLQQRNKLLQNTLGCSHKCRANFNRPAYMNTEKPQAPSPVSSFEPCNSNQSHHVARRPCEQTIAYTHCTPYI